MALGFSFLQLSGNQKSGIRLGDLIAQSKLSHPPVDEDKIAGTVKDQNALGYLQANCAHCHNPLGIAGFLDLHHASGTATLPDENGYKQLLDSGLLIPGNSKQSYFFQRLSNGEMPPNKTTQKYGIDAAGVLTIEEWITASDN